MLYQFKKWVLLKHHQVTLVNERMCWILIVNFTFCHTWACETLSFGIKLKHWVRENWNTDLWKVKHWVRESETLSCENWNTEFVKVKHWVVKTETLSLWKWNTVNLKHVCEVIHLKCLVFVKWYTLCGQHLWEVLQN